VVALITLNKKMSREETDNRLGFAMHQIVCPYDHDTDVTFYVKYPDTLPAENEKVCPTCKKEFVLKYEGDETEVNVDIRTQDDD
jgi:hypothetical protein